jgi:hypothetical protein
MVLCLSLNFMAGRMVALSSMLHTSISYFRKTTSEGYNVQPTLDSCLRVQWCRVECDFANTYEMQVTNRNHYALENVSSDLPKFVFVRNEIFITRRYEYMNVMAFDFYRRTP